AMPAALPDRPKASLPTYLARTGRRGKPGLTPRPPARRTGATPGSADRRLQKEDQPGGVRRQIRAGATLAAAAPTGRLDVLRRGNDAKRHRPGARYRPHHRGPAAGRGA